MRNMPKHTNDEHAKTDVLGYREEPSWKTRAERAAKRADLDRSTWMRTIVRAAIRASERSAGIVPAS